MAIVLARVKEKSLYNKQKAILIGFFGNLVLFSQVLYASLLKGSVLILLSGKVKQTHYFYCSYTELSGPIIFMQAETPQRPIESQEKPS